MDKIKLLKLICNINPYHIFDGNDVDIAIKILTDEVKAIKEKYPKYNSLKFSFDYHDQDMFFEIYGERLETDEEYIKRVDKVRRAEETLREKELRQLAELKAKYENN